MQEEPSPGPALAHSPERGPSRAEANTALVRRYFEMWNTGRGTQADALVTSTYVEHAHPDCIGPAALRSVVPRLHALYPGALVLAEVVAADVEFVAVRMVCQSGEGDGHPLAPRSGMALFRVADGKLAEQWSWYSSVH
jgi:hypothetical protein